MIGVKKQKQIDNNNNKKKQKKKTEKNNNNNNKNAYPEQTRIHRPTRDSNWDETSNF